MIHTSDDDDDDNDDDDNGEAECIVLLERMNVKGGREIKILIVQFIIRRWKFTSFFVFDCTNNLILKKISSLSNMLKYDGCTFLYVWHAWYEWADLFFVHSTAACGGVEERFFFLIMQDTVAIAYKIYL